MHYLRFILIHYYAKNSNSTNSFDNYDCSKGNVLQTLTVNGEHHAIWPYPHSLHAKLVVNLVCGGSNKTLTLLGGVALVA